jgi:hypothetical protein
MDELLEEGDSASKTDACMKKLCIGKKTVITDKQHEPGITSAEIN